MQHNIRKNEFSQIISVALLYDILYWNQKIWTFFKHFLEMVWNKIISHMNNRVDEKLIFLTLNDFLTLKRDDLCFNSTHFGASFFLAESFLNVIYLFFPEILSDKKTDYRFLTMKYWIVIKHIISTGGVRLVAQRIASWPVFIE